MGRRKNKRRARRKECCSVCFELRGSCTHNASIIALCDGERAEAKNRFCPSCGAVTGDWKNSGRCTIHGFYGVTRKEFRTISKPRRAQIRLERKRDTNRRIADLKAHHGLEKKPNWIGCAGKVIYRRYIQSEEWFRKRKMVIERDRCCVLCSRKATHVHHITYQRVGAESLTDLVLLCRACHHHEHETYALHDREEFWHQQFIARGKHG